MPQCQGMQRVLGLALVLGVAGVPRSLESSDSSSDPPLHVEGTFPVPSDPAVVGTELGGWSSAVEVGAA